MQNHLIPIDFHCHSVHSDGACEITELLDMAKANGGQYLALTDHDTVSGISEARQYAKQINLNLISGVEISVTWNKNEVIHILGLNIDETNQILVKNLNILQSFRLSRGKKIAEKLDKIGIKNSLEEALKYCKTPHTLSRTHFAKFLVNNGYAKSIGKAFTNYLAHGKPGYVSQEWANLENAVNWITQSGGIAVIAHPCRYKYTRTKLLRLIAQFKDLGGRGIEVISSSHSKDEVTYIAGIASQKDLLCSVGSDFHSINSNYKNPLVGINYPLPSICIPIYNKLGIFL